MKGSYGLRLKESQDLGLQIKCLLEDHQYVANTSIVKKVPKREWNLLRIFANMWVCVKRWNLPKSEQVPHIYKIRNEHSKYPNFPVNLSSVFFCCWWSSFNYFRWKKVDTMDKLASTRNKKFSMKSYSIEVRFLLSS